MPCFLKRSSLPVIYLRNRELLKVMIINDSKLKFEMSWSDFGIYGMENLYSEWLIISIMFNREFQAG